MGGREGKGMKGEEVVTCIYAQTTVHTQIQQMMKGHIYDLTDSKVIGDTLESALELGEKHEAFATKCKEVRVEGVRGGG